jgi:hypothetical protein
LQLRETFRVGEQRILFLPGKNLPGFLKAVALFELGESDNKVNIDLARPAGARCR